MLEIKKNKAPSSLVQSVLALDNHFGNLERLAEKIGEIKLKSEFDFEQVRHLMKRFADHGNGIALEVVELSTHLQDARARAEAAATVVSAKAALLQARQDEEEKKTETFRSLADKVSRLGEEIKDLKNPDGAVLSEEERPRIFERLAVFESQLQPLIEEALVLNKESQDLK